MRGNSRHLNLYGKAALKTQKPQQNRLHAMEFAQRYRYFGRGDDDRACDKNWLNSCFNIINKIPDKADRNHIGVLFQAYKDAR